MTEEVIQNKATTIERCVKRAREEYNRNPETFDRDYTRQDAAILNIQRACEAALDMGQHPYAGMVSGSRKAPGMCSHFWPKPAGSMRNCPTPCGAWSAFATLPCMTTKACTCPSPSRLLRNISTIFFSSAKRSCETSSTKSCLEYRKARGPDRNHSGPGLGSSRLQNPDHVESNLLNC